MLALIVMAIAFGLTPIVVAIIFRRTAVALGKKGYAWFFLGEVLSLNLNNGAIEFAKMEASGSSEILGLAIVFIATSTIVALMIWVCIRTSWRTYFGKVECPSCGSKEFGMRLPVIAAIFIVISLPWLYRYYDTSLTRNARQPAFLFSFILFGVGFGLTLCNRKAICLNCRDKYPVKCDSLICFRCPSCKQNLEGVRNSMIGKTYSCLACEAVFEIKRSNAEETPSPENSGQLGGASRPP